MVGSGADALLRKPDQPGRATFLELFFDLVFIFAFTRVSQQLVGALTGERRAVLPETGRTLLLLLALLTVWFVTAWVTDLYDPERPEVQLVVAGTMFGTLVMAVAVPQAFGARAMGFAGAYVAIHLGRGLVFVALLRGHPARQRALAVMVWFIASAVPWLAGALVSDNGSRTVLWTVAITIDYLAAMLFYRTPWHARRDPPRWPVVADYLAERYRQFFIIALGELILVTGIAYGERRFTGAAATAAFVVAFVTTTLLWRVYIFRAGELLPAAIAKAVQPGRLVRRALIAHQLMIAGVVAVAVGLELVIGHPTGQTDPAWVGVIVGGPLLFLVGRSAFEYAVYARVSPSRLIALLVLAGSAPVMPRLSPLAAAGGVAAVLAGVVVTDARRARRHPPEAPSPPR